MTPLFKKLNFKNQPEIVLLDAPESFENEASVMSEFAKIQQGWQPDEKANFALAFATRQSEVDALAVQFSEKTAPDAILWIAYPKGTSKKYRCEFNRDTGWQLLGERGFEPVKIVAIDEDWSALRFRRVEFIGEMTRSFAMSERGKQKASPSPISYEMPDDFRQSLEKSPAALAFFERLAPSHRKEYLRWILEAKREETRHRRLEKAVQMLLDGQKLS